MPATAAPAPAAPTATIIARPTEDPAAAAARIDAIRQATERLRLAREAEAAASPALQETITREGTVLQGIEQEIQAANDIINAKGPSIAQKEAALRVLATTLRQKRADASAAEELRRTSAEALRLEEVKLAGIRTRKGPIETAHDNAKRLMDTAITNFNSADGLHRAAVAHATAAGTAATTSNATVEFLFGRTGLTKLGRKTKADAEVLRLKDLLDTAEQKKNRAAGVHAPLKLQLEDISRDERTQDGLVQGKSSSHARSVSDAERKRQAADQLKQQFITEKAQHDSEKRALENARAAKAAATARWRTTKDAIDTAERELQRLRQETATAQSELSHIQPLPELRNPAVQGDEDLALRYKLEPGTLENAGKGDNFTEDQMKAVVDTFKSELMRTGAWGNKFDFKVDKLLDKIEIWNTDDSGAPLTGPQASRIIIRPTLISFHGKVDDSIMQASLVVGDKLWGDAGIRIKSSSNSLKHGLVANAARLKELGRIKKYKASTWAYPLIGYIGEGFDAAKEGVTAPHDSWLYRFNPFSLHDEYMHRIRNGLDSYYSGTPEQEAQARRPFFGGGPTTMSPQPTTA